MKELECRFLPHGGYSLIPAVLATAAWLASLAQDGCDYAVLTGPSVQSITQSPALPFLEVGMGGYRAPAYYPQDNHWGVVYTDECLSYEDGGEGEVGGDAFAITTVQEDAAWNAGRWLSFLSLVLGGAGSMFAWSVTCFVLSKPVWRATGIEIFAAALLKALAFVWLLTGMCTGDGNDCALFFGSKMDIVSASLYACAAAAALVKYPAPRTKIMTREQRDREYEQEQLAMEMKHIQDGTGAGAGSGGSGATRGGKRVPPWTMKQRGPSGTGVSDYPSARMRVGDIL